MKICISCHVRYSDEEWQCPSCHARPEEIEGFKVLSQTLERDVGGYNVEHFEKLAPLEANNFWFRSRNKLIIWALKKYYPEMTNYFEIGCGTGYVLLGVKSEFPEVSLAASDIYIAGLKYTMTRVEKADLFKMDARNIPFYEEYDVIGAFDVLEHIVEDQQVLSEMYRAVKTGGGIIITVPQHQFLWSQTDVRACHIRRYSAADLKTKVEAAGFKVIMSTSFVSLLLPLMVLSRLNKKNGNSKGRLTELRLSSTINWFLERILGFERILIQTGIRFSAGGSLLIIAEKT